MSSPLFRELFGPVREDVWRQLAVEIGGNFVDGGFWSGGKVEAAHAEWRITLHVVARPERTDREAPRHGLANPQWKQRI